MKKTTQKPKPKPTPPPEQGFTFSIPKGCKTCLSYFAVILGFFVSAFIAAGPFDGWTCMLTARIVCENIDFVGNCKLPEYSPVLDVFKDQFLSGSAKGAQLSIWHKNEPIIEGYGSYTENNYTRESVQVVFSVTDVMTSMVIAVLQDRHFLKYSDKVATYWPEFAQNGKENITIAQVLRHESGLDIFEQPITWGQFVNHLGESEEPIHKLIERTTPAFPPAIRSLHGFTRGIILDEIAKRVDPSKRRLSQIWEDEIRKPLKIDCFMGLPSELMNRFHISQKWSGSYQFIHLMLPYMVYPSIVDPGTRKILDLYSDKEGWPRRLEKLMQFPRTTTKGGYAATEDFITSGQPSIGGICSADGLGKALAVMANKGSLNGFKLLSSDGFERSIAVTTPAMYDANIGVATKFTDGGFAVDAFWFPNVHGPNEQLSAWFGWGGFGGSIAQFNPQLGIAFVFSGNAEGMGVIGDERSKAFADGLAQVVHLFNK